MRAVALVLVVVACKGKDTPPQQAPPPTTSDAKAAAVRDWTTRCAAALRDAPKATAARRVQVVLEGCQPCGDWTPLLRWNTPAAEGGPSLEAIERAMTACNAFCNPDARQHFLGTLEEARGRATAKPWRLLGEACKADVSAVPEARFMSAPYFALDRIARATATQPALASLAGAVELPLPAWSITGAGFELASSPVTRPEAGPVQISVSQASFQVGLLPRAKLGATGLAVTMGPVPYPGAAVDAKGLPGALDQLTGKQARAQITVIAPSGMPARRVLDAVTAAGDRTLVLGVAANGAPEGWSLPAHVPVTLVTTPARDALVLSLGESADALIRQIKDAPAGKLAITPTVVLEDTATVASLAKLLGALAYRDVHAVALKRP